MVVAGDPDRDNVELVKIDEDSSGDLSCVSPALLPMTLIDMPAMAVLNNIPTTCGGYVHGSGTTTAGMCIYIGMMTRMNAFNSNFK